MNRLEGLRIALVIAVGATGCTGNLSSVDISTRLNGDGQYSACINGINAWQLSPEDYDWYGGKALSTCFNVLANEVKMTPDFCGSEEITGKEGLVVGNAVVDVTPANNANGGDKAQNIANAIKTACEGQNATMGATATPSNNQAR